MATVATRRIVQYGEVQIEVYSRGVGTRVVMLPSLGRGATDFDKIAERIAASGYRVLCPQPRGIGASRGPLTDITLHDYAGDVVAVIDDDGGGPSFIAGHAFGNFVARAVASDHPQLTRAIALLAAPHVWPLPPDVRESINKSHQMSLPDEERIRHLQHAFFAPGNDPRVWLGGWNEAVMLAERAATEATPKEEWWTAGTTPVVDLQPENDVCTPPASRNRYREEFGAHRVTIVSIPHAGHALLPEQPDAVADALIAYMKQIKA
ncbi:MAG: hydrolase [Burkholderiales bacterium]|jgi:pimeloyl-ACP methyl ester carboxylesterase|nr:hydrolase [Burkholderiales bacterium]